MWVRSMKLSFLVDGAKKTLLDLIKLRGPFPLDEMPAAVGLAKTTIRQHLLQLENQGLVHRSYISPIRGRPRLAFTLSKSGQKLFPTQDAGLLRDLIEYLTKHEQQSFLMGFFKTYWNKRKRRFEEILLSTRAKINTQTRMSALLQLLEEEGFMPQVQYESKRKSVVCECNCPFPEAVKGTDLPCKLELNFIRWALRSPVKRTGYIPDGDNVCAYMVVKTATSDFRTKKLKT